MNTFQLKCFLAAAATLNFARAAERINVSQPTITHQIKSLEDELNVRLFNRSTRFVELTAEGETFISDAKSMLAIEVQAKTRFNSLSDKPVEVISVGCGNYIQLAMLSDILSQMKEVYPNLHPRLLVAPIEQLEQNLGTERLDILFAIEDPASVKSGAKYKELLVSHVVCIGRRSDRMTGKESISVDDLKKESLIFCDPMSLTPEMAKLQFRLIEDRDPKSIHICSSSMTAYILARSGFGIALLPDLLIPNDPEMMKIKLTNAPTLSFGLYYKPSVGDSVLRQFISLAAHHFSELGKQDTAVR